VLKRHVDHPNIITLVERLLMVRPKVLWQAPQDELMSAVRWLLGNGEMPFHNVELFTDGSAFDLDTDFGMAGRAVVHIPLGPGWFDPGPKCALRALGSPLVGLHQSVEGAELLAILILVRHSLAPITVGVDASYVVDGLLSRGREGTGGSSHSWAFLWRLVWDAIEDFGGLCPEGLTVVKVKGHGTIGDVEAGRLTRWERRGNVEVVIKQPPKIQLTLTAHEFVEEVPTNWPWETLAQGPSVLQRLQGLWQQQRLLPWQRLRAVQMAERTGMEISTSLSHPLRVQVRVRRQRCLRCPLVLVVMMFALYVVFEWALNVAILFVNVTDCFASLGRIAQDILRKATTQDVFDGSV
ncbi:unnamed protein product, partial [Prorocentrum cordatum]